MSEDLSAPPTLVQQSVLPQPQLMLAGGQIAGVSDRRLEQHPGLSPITHDSMSLALLPQRRAPGDVILPGLRCTRLEAEASPVQSSIKHRLGSMSFILTWA